MIQAAGKPTPILHLWAFHRWDWVLIVAFALVGCGQRQADRPSNSGPDEPPNITAGAQTGDPEAGAADAIPAEETSDDSPATGTASANQPRFDTPQACFEALQKAISEQNPTALLLCYVERYRDQRIGRYLFDLDREVTFGRPRAAAATQLLKDHGINVGQVTTVLQRASEQGADQLAEIFVQLGKLVDRRDDLVTRASKVISKPLVPTYPDLVGGELSDVQVGQLYAVGQYRNPDSEESLAISFQRENGSWLISPFVNVAADEEAGSTRPQAR